MAKKRNPTSTDSTKKKKKRSKPAPSSVSMKLKVPKPNPFESIWSRRKFDILGKKRKGEERRIGLVRSLAIEKRKKTLLNEYEQSTKSSVFVDKRIGEQNEELGEFDKAILRSQRERQLKVGKKSKYNLSDAEEDELEIQGFGAYPERDDFDDEIPIDEDEDEKVMGSKEMPATSEKLSSNGSNNSFQGNLLDGEENRPKTKKEVMEEIILKSKFFKAQKAKDKEENEQILEQLDEDFASLVQSEALLALTQPNKMNALKALVNKGTSDVNAKKDDAVDTHSKVSAQQKEKPDFYDKLVSEMALDIRARPSNRTKTPEEIAQEEKERLEQLEEERQKRMNATYDLSDEEDYASEDNDASTKQLRSMSGDDLGDSFSHNEEPTTKLGWIKAILKREHADNLESEDEDVDENEGDSESAEDDGEEEETDVDDEHVKSHSVKDWEQSDDDNIGTDLEEDEEDDKEGVDIEADKQSYGKASEIKGKEIDLFDDNMKKGNVKQYSTQGELPYTIHAPKSFEEFVSLLEDRSDDQIIEAIRRIRTYNAVTVASENRKKIQVFYGILLQYFAVLANKRPLNFKLINLLVKPLMEMSTEIPYFAAICARQRLLRTRTQFCEDLKNTGNSSWPSLKTLFLLRLWSMIFPCSDFRHVVMTPAMLLMCEYLMRCPIMSGRDIAIGSFICSLVLSVTRQSRKFCPEAIIFIQTLLMSSMDREHKASRNLQLYHLMEIKALGPMLRIQSSVEEIKPLDFLVLMDLPENSAYFNSDNFRISLLMALTGTLQGFVSIYEGLSSFPETFLPISKLLFELVAQNHIPDELQNKMKDVAQQIEKKVQEHHMLRQPLKMRKKKPVPIKLVAPQFEEDFVKGRDYDPDRERAERKKLKKLLKREAKGAARELRKDNYFLFEVKERDKAVLEAEKTEQHGKARAFLQEQEHAFKSGQLGKGRKRRR